MVTFGCSRAEIESWPHSDLVALAAYDIYQPFGSERDNWHMATLASLYCQAHTPKGKQSAKMKDFMYIDQGTKKQTETRSFFSALSAKAKKNAE